jgi:signal transduction histidine kinase
MFKKIPKNIALSFHTVEDLRTRIGWYINLRWIAIFGVLASVPMSQGMFHFKLAFTEIIFIASTLLIINIIYFFLWRHLSYKTEIQELVFAEIQIILDLILISFLIHYTGGIDNPFFFLYLVQVILSGILFPGAVLPYINAICAAFLLTLWTFLEYSGAVNQFSLDNSQMPFSYLIVSLLAFYIINFSGIYIINNFMMHYSYLKKVIDEKNKLLEKAIEDRGRTFRFSAHELKAPVTAIKSTLEVVRDLYLNNLTPEASDLITRAERRSDQVLNMVKEMITISQYTLSSEKPVKEKVFFGDWILQVVKQQQVFAHAKGIKLFVLYKEKDFKVEIDRLGLEKVLENLINNALRYTPSGGSVKVKPYVQKNKFGFSVSDTGIGIAEKDLEHIFEEFYRTKEAKQMEQIGTGLGLNLVKEIVKKNEGNINVKSKQGKGSKFIVEFPLPEIEEEKHRYKHVYKHYLFE